MTRDAPVNCSKVHCIFPSTVYLHWNRVLSVGDLDVIIYCKLNLIHSETYQYYSYVTGVSVISILAKEYKPIQFFQTKGSTYFVVYSLSSKRPAQAFR